MTRIQQVLFELESAYLGHPYFVTGHALFNALARRVDERTRRTLHVSHGVFLPGEYGTDPASPVSPSPGRKLGRSLPDIETYEGLFVFRDAAQRWLTDTRPRDAHNSHPLEQHQDRIAFAERCLFGRPPAKRHSKRSVPWEVHCYLHAKSGDDAVLPLPDNVLDGLRVGGARNYGFGELSLLDTQVIDLDDLNYARLDAAAEADRPCRLELLAPYVLESEYPGADSQSVPWWWEPESDAPAGLRRQETRLVDGADAYALQTVDHGQIVRYAGDDPIQTAKNGVLRVGTHSRYGFGEFRVRPPDRDRVPEHAAALAGGDA